MNIIDKNEKYKYKIDISYPLTKFDDINKEIFNMIYDIKNKFIKVSKRNIMTNIYFNLYITYEEYNCNDITSYIFKISSFTGGIHSNNYLRSIRFIGNKMITINTLISKDKNILDKLSSYSRRYFFSNNKFKTEEIINMMMYGTKNIRENYSNFAFTENGILVFFDYYQIAPYYYGIQKVLIPYNKLL